MPTRPGSPSDLKRTKARAQKTSTRATPSAGLLEGVVRPNPHPRAGTRGIGAQPAYIIDKEKLVQLSETMCSIDEMALILGVAPKFLQDHYQKEIDLGHANAKSNLRSVQWAKAKGGDTVMQIWLGKQWLGQKDRQLNEHTGPDGKPIALEKTKRTIAYIPDNGRQAAARAPEGSNGNNGAHAGG